SLAHGAEGCRRAPITPTPAAGTRPPPHFCPSRSTNRWRKTVFEKLVTTSRPTGRRRHPKPAEDEIPTRPGVPVEVRTVSSSDGKSEERTVGTEQSGRWM